MSGIILVSMYDVFVWVGVCMFVMYVINVRMHGMYACTCVLVLWYDSDVG